MLTAILGSTELMAIHIKENSAAMKLLDSIQKAASRSADLTGQLLAFSRKGNKKTVLMRIDTLINEVIVLLERTINKKIILESHHSAENTYVDGDPALLQNALLNLGVNARDAMHEEGTITFSTTNVVLDSDYCNSCNFNITPGAFIEISVSDTGIGMSNEVIQHVFEPFFTTKEIGKGTGLGLAAVYGTVTDHHGCITITSQPGTGTTFKLYLPLSESVTTDHQKFEEIVRGAGGVLLVDDEEILREVGQALLEDLGYRVYLAVDGEEALEVYAREKNNISLVILDMLMPRMGGKETLIYLKEKYPDIRVLISSGFHQDGTIQELKEIGAKGFLQKPYLRQELCKAISDAIK
jgi:CheY-like chemotaxis protein